MNWLLPVEELTKIQQRLIDYRIDENLLVVGPPGSGKTGILLHRARTLSSRLLVPPARYHIFLGNHLLKGYLRSSLSLLNISENSVSAWETWQINFYRNFINAKLPEDSNFYPDLKAIRRAILQAIRPVSHPHSIVELILQPVMEIFRTSQIKLPIYEFALVDEGEMLDRDTLKLLTAIAKHITIVADLRRTHREEIFGPLVDFRRKEFLTTSQRCSPLIIELAAQLIDDPQVRTQFLTEAKRDQVEKELPLIYLANDSRDEREEMIKTIAHRLDRGENIGVLLPSDELVVECAEWLKDPRIQVIRLISDRLGRDMHRDQFANDYPKLVSINNAKGMSFDTVIIPFLNQRLLSNIDAEQLRQMLFNAVTRASKWVYLSGIKGSEIPIIKRLLSYANQGLLHLRQAMPPVTHRPAPPVETDDENLLDLL